MHTIVGRAHEVAVLDGFLADAHAQPSAVLIEGEPGIGKTTLLDALIARADERDHAVLVCRPSRSEMDLSYVGLVGLLGQVPEHDINALPDPQARVLRMVLRREEPDAAFDRLSLGVALVAAVRALASIRTVLIAIDDVQFLDHPTARTLAFALRRLAGAGVRVALVRSGGGLDQANTDEPVDWRTELTRAMPGGRFSTVRIGPIGPSELSRILRRVLGWVPAWPRLTRIAELAAGNPLYALELARAGADPDGSLPSSVVDLARSRIARLPDHVREVVELAAVPRTPNSELLRRLGPALDLGDALAAAVRAGIMIVDGDRVRLAHPILARAAYESIAPQRRRALHHAVAILSDDLEERARHLAASADGPDSHVAVILEAAAEQAVRRGAPDAAADLLRLACRLTPSIETESLALRRIAFGRLLHGAGDAPAAIAELESLVATLPPGLLRARALYHLMYVTRLSGSLGRAVDHGVRAAEEAAGDPSFQAEVYELLSRISDDDIARKLDAARRGLEAIDQLTAPDPYVVFHVRAALVEAEFYAGLGLHLERIEGLNPGPGRRFPPVRTAERGEDLIGRLLTYDGRIDAGLDILRGMYDRAAVEGRSVLPAILGWMAEGQIMAGRFEAAAALTQEAIERSEETGGAAGTPWELGFHGVALAMLGRLDEAETVAGQVVARAAADPAVGFDAAPAHLALGIAAAARGRFDDATTHLRRLDRMKCDAGIREPRLCAHAGDLIEALLGAGLVSEAEEALARLETEAETSAGRWSLAIAARCRALALAGAGRLDEALAAAEKALSLMDDLPMPFERARTVLVIGQIRRRRKEKRPAHDCFVQALRTFEELGTPVWADRARSELARIPQRRPAEPDPAVLSPTEENIAELAAAGLTNREIADRIFLSPKTVEVNLTRVYRKLGVRSRAELASRLAKRGVIPDSSRTARP